MALIIFHATQMRRIPLFLNVYNYFSMSTIISSFLWPRWPGLLTRDPTCGEYYDAPLDKENEITHYHVEFFGRTRSRAWLVPALVHPLRSMNEIEEAPKFKKIQGRQLNELKKSYEFALKEAHNLLNKTSDQRLETCHFKYIEGERWFYDQYLNSPCIANIYWWTDRLWDSHAWQLCQLSIYRQKSVEERCLSFREVYPS